MPQVFPKSANPIARILVIAFADHVRRQRHQPVGVLSFGLHYGRQRITEQPVPFSHKHHVSELGIDCRYCHTGVETSAVAGIPPTKTCMNCHQQMWVGAELLEPVRNSYKTNVPIEWTKIHNTPHYVYFNHSIHIGKGVGCVSCHEPHRPDAAW